MNDKDKKEIVKLTTEQFVECQKRARKDRRNYWFHNTRQLMKHYNSLNSHSKKAVTDIEEAFSVDNILPYGRNVINVTTIKNSAAKTYIIMQHVNSMLKILKDNYKRAGQMRKYRVFEKHYIQFMTFKNIAMEEHIDERTAYRDANDVLNALSVLLFGIDELISS